MNITRTSDLTGVTRTMDLPITLVQILAWQHGKLVQEAFPQLNADQREFIMTGISAEEWDTLLPPEDSPVVDYPALKAIFRSRP